MAGAQENDDCKSTSGKLTTIKLCKNPYAEGSTLVVSVYDVPEMNIAPVFQSLS